MKVNIAGILVDSLTKQKTLSKISEFVASGQPHLIVTTYSEFVVFAQKDPEYKTVLNEAALSLPDGVGILWAAKYLSIPATNKFLALWQIVYSGAAIIFNRNYINSPIPEQITGSRLIWDIAELANNNKYTLALIGGGDRVATLASLKLKEKFPELKIYLTVSNNEKFDDRMVEKIAASNSDILLIAYQPPNQEKWLYNNLSKLNIKVAMGLGGTFDYLAGKRLPAPKFVHSTGLEWLWRLITQPWRIKRIWNAIAMFIFIVYKHKVVSLH